MELKRIGFGKRGTIKSSFNRTTVELKRQLGYSLGKRVFGFNRTTVELKPDALGRLSLHSCSFNRTTVELVLIVPQWN